MRSSVRRPVRVVVVDDEALVRSGLELILTASAGVDVVATSDDVHAVETVTRTQPDVVLLDIRMPVVDGLTILRALMDTPRPPAVAMLTTFDTDEHIADALEGGARGFLLKDTDPETLPELVKTLAADGMVLSPSAGGRLVGRSVSTHAPPQHSEIGALTERERAVLALIGEGLGNADIARVLRLRPATVKDHVSAIRTKLNVTSRVHAALIAARAGLTPGTRS